jgi:hypothetical protein
MPVTLSWACGGGVSTINGNGWGGGKQMANHIDGRQNNVFNHGFAGGHHWRARERRLGCWLSSIKNKRLSHIEEGKPQENNKETRRRGPLPAGGSEEPPAP